MTDSRWFVAVLCLFTFGTFALAQDEAPEAEPEPTVEEQIDDALRSDHIEFINDLIDEDDASIYKGYGDHYADSGDPYKGAVYYLIAVNKDPKYAPAMLRLAATFAATEQDTDNVVMPWLERAAENGLWMHRETVDWIDFGEDLPEDPRFKAIVDKAHQRWKTESTKPGHTGYYHIRVPEGDPPAGGWPVVVYLHGYGDGHFSYTDNAEQAAELGMIGITISGNEPMGDDCYRWKDRAIADTHAYIQKVLKRALTANDHAKADLKRVYTLGFSQGALHGALLAGAYPDHYAGTVCISPGGDLDIPARPVAGKRARPMFLVYGNAEQIGNKLMANTLKKSWDRAKFPVKVHRHDGGHTFPPDSEKVLKGAYRWLREHGDK